MPLQRPDTDDLPIRVAHAYQRAVDWESFYP